MIAEAFKYEDLPLLAPLQPADWNDITKPYTYYLKSTFCQPIKLMEGNVLVAVGTTILNEDSAWLATIVVHPEFRDQGYGRALSEALLKNIDQKKYDSVFLDATEAGYPLYQKLGFEMVTEYLHVKECEDGFPALNTAHLVSYQPQFKDRIYALDQFASGENRHGILSEHIDNSIVYLKNEQVEGVYFPTLRDGLVVALTPEAGTELLSIRALTFHFGIFPIENTTAKAFYDSQQYQLYRTSRRMCLGRQRPWRPAHLYNRISGQLG